MIPTDMTRAAARTRLKAATKVDRYDGAKTEATVADVTKLLATRGDVHCVELRGRCGGRPSSEYRFVVFA